MVVFRPDMTKTEIYQDWASDAEDFTFKKDGLDDEEFFSNENPAKEMIIINFITNHFLPLKEKVLSKMDKELHTNEQGEYESSYGVPRDRAFLILFNSNENRTAPLSPIATTAIPHLKQYKEPARVVHKILQLQRVP